MCNVIFGGGIRAIGDITRQGFETIHRFNAVHAPCGAEIRDLLQKQIAAAVGKGDREEDCGAGALRAQLGGPAPQVRRG